MSKKGIQKEQQSNKTNQKAKMSLIRAQNLNANDVEFEKIKATNGGGKKVRMTTGGNSIVLQLPNARVPFGLSCFENEKDKSIKKYSMEVSLGGTPQMEKFRENLEELDEHNVKTIADNSVPWLKETQSAMVVKAALYGSLIKPDKKGESPPRFKFKLPMWDGKPMFKVEDSGGKELKIYEVVDGEPVVNWDWAQNGMEIKAIVECEGLWVVNKNVYCTWRAVKLRITKSSGRNEFDFMDDDDEEDVEDNDNDNDNGTEDNEVEVDSDNESYEEEE